MLPFTLEFGLCVFGRVVMNCSPSCQTTVSLAPDLTCPSDLPKPPLDYIPFYALRRHDGQSAIGVHATYFRAAQHAASMVDATRGGRANEKMEAALRAVRCCMSCSPHALDEYSLAWQA